MGKTILLDVDYDVRDHIFHMTIGRPRSNVTNLDLVNMGIDDPLTAVTLDKSTREVVGWIVHDFPETNNRLLPLSLLSGSPAIELHYRGGRVFAKLNGKLIFDICLCPGQQDVKVLDWSALDAG